MQNKKKYESCYKKTGIILYFIVSLSGLSILLLFPPSTLLLNKNSNDFKTKVFLLQNFGKSIHENINTSLIKNITLMKENEECPENFSTLSIKNQYYGNFTKFFGNRNICIERMNNTKYSFRNLLEKSELSALEDEKPCGKLIPQSNKILYVKKDSQCPLTNIMFINGHNLLCYKCIIDNDIIMNALFGQMDFYNDYPPVIINLDIIINQKYCEESSFIYYDLSCEFPDENECFLKDNSGDYYFHVSSDAFSLPELVRWNLVNDNNIDHNFCKDNLIYNFITNGYVNFTTYNLKEFELEFPSDNFENNALYKTVNIFYKYSKNIDRLFYLLSCILFFLSLIQLIVQILLYYNDYKVTFYFIYGLILFILKLLSYFGMVINHYFFYLKIEKVYVVLVDEQKNKILELYSSIRKRFIVIIVIFLIIGFIIICVDYIIFVFNLTIEWRFPFVKVIKCKDKETIIVDNKSPENIRKQKSHINKKLSDLYNTSFNEINEETNKQLYNTPIKKLTKNLNKGSLNKLKQDTENKVKKEVENKLKQDKENKVKKDSENKIKNENENKSKKSSNNKIKKKLNTKFKSNSDDESLRSPNKQSNSNFYYDTQSDNIFTSLGSIPNNIFTNRKKVKLKFVFKNELQENYEIEILNHKTFNNVIKKLKILYPKLKDKSMRILQYESQIINKEKTIYDNGITEDVKIIIIP